ncbi:toprim domain-containing protein [Faecalibacter rhinopitheci]|uniref:Toprim domain-containing protein n=1 Tax=Faecalibacter rhinopitheci TaxID=2779678 RepID=A0A8J7K4Y2_9FLAO|nr:toprim domain-containing protein [Faecalibacter rhinopitheci]MBF0597983.1 toprim domain-containing protein [Faecalibacter rhinopitheci]
MNLNEINSLDFVKILDQKIGFKPKKINNKSIWFKSPFRPNESTPSFHISKIYKYDIWFDHGNGLGGKNVDFFIHYLKTDVKGVLKYFNENSFSFQQQKVSNDIYTPKNNYSVLELKKITSLPLIQYLDERKLPLEIVNRYCKEIHYKLNDKKYYAIAFPNNQNGFEIRNKYVKMCLVIKNITLIKNNQNQLKLFESWSDFISYLFLFPTEEFKNDFLILNSIALLRKNLELINQYEKIESYLDHDDSGKSATFFLETELKNKVKDDSFFYKNFKDLNDFLIKAIS